MVSSTIKLVPSDPLVLIRSHWYEHPSLTCSYCYLTLPPDAKFNKSPLNFGTEQSKQPLVCPTPVLVLKNGSFLHPVSSFSFWISNVCNSRASESTPRAAPDSVAFQKGGSSPFIFTHALPTPIKKKKKQTINKQICLFSSLMPRLFCSLATPQDFPGSAFLYESGSLRSASSLSLISKHIPSIETSFLSCQWCSEFF